MDVSLWSYYGLCDFEKLNYFVYRTFLSTSRNREISLVAIHSYFVI